jgi:anti-anti-sigma regulatory factor
VFPMPFSILSLDSGVTLVALEGDLDVFTVERLRPELRGLVRRTPLSVEVDLSRLRSISPRGMRALALFFSDLAGLGCRMTVKGLRDQPLKSFEATLVDAILNASHVVN